MVPPTHGLLKRGLSSEDFLASEHILRFSRNQCPRQEILANCHWNFRGNPPCTFHLVFSADQGIAVAPYGLISLPPFLPYVPLKCMEAGRLCREVVQMLHKTVRTQNFGFLASIRQCFRDVLVVAKEASGRE